MSFEKDKYDELCCYTLGHGGSAFIHQYVVDAFAAQHADINTKPIQLTFALVGLYLHVEKQLSGKQVQQVHMKLGQRKRTWPTFTLPPDRGSITASDVIAARPGSARDAMIHHWCLHVWEAFSESRQTVISLLDEFE